MKKYFFLIILIILPLVVFAQSTNPCTTTSGTPGTSSASLPACISQIYTWSLGVAAILAVLMSIIGGYQVMTAQGNAEQSTSGKSKIVSSIIGLVLLFGAYILLQTINLDLVKLDLSSIGNLNNNPPAPCTTVPKCP